MKLIFLFVFLIIVIILLSTKFNIEKWQDYTLKPYNYIFSGRDPLYFYRRDRYRIPYRYGFKFYQSYPIPHMTYNL